LFKIHSKRAPRVKPDRKKNIGGDDQWGLRMNPSTIMRAMHFFTSEKLISLFDVFEILLPCCLTDDSGSGARGGGISGCEGDLPGEILTTGMFISTFCGLSVLFKSTLPGTPDRPYPPSSETFGGVKACFSVGVGSTCGELSACCCSRSFSRAQIFSFKTSSITRSFLLLLHT
jgi:hypothetical protein